MAPRGRTGGRGKEAKVIKKEVMAETKKVTKEAIKRLLSPLLSDASPAEEGVSQDQEQEEVSVRGLYMAELGGLEEYVLGVVEEASRRVEEEEKGVREKEELRKKAEEEKEELKTKNLEAVRKAVAVEKEKNQNFKILLGEAKKKLEEATAKLEESESGALRLKEELDEAKETITKNEREFKDIQITHSREVNDWEIVFQTQEVSNANLAEFATQKDADLEELKDVLAKAEEDAKQTAIINMSDIHAFEEAAEKLQEDNKRLEKCLDSVNTDWEIKIDSIKKDQEMELSDIERRHDKEKENVKKVQEELNVNKRYYEKEIFAIETRHEREKFEIKQAQEDHEKKYTKENKELEQSLNSIKRDKNQEIYEIEKRHDEEKKHFKQGKKELKEKHTKFEALLPELEKQLKETQIKLKEMEIIHSQDKSYFEKNEIDIKTLREHEKHLVKEHKLENEQHIAGMSKIEEQRVKLEEKMGKVVTENEKLKKEKLIDEHEKTELLDQLKNAEEEQNKFELKMDTMSEKQNEGKKRLEEYEHLIVNLKSSLQNISTHNRDLDEQCGLLSAQALQLKSEKEAIQANFKDLQRSEETNKDLLKNKRFMEEKCEALLITSTFVDELKLEKDALQGAITEMTKANKLMADQIELFSSEKDASKVQKEELVNAKEERRVAEESKVKLSKEILVLKLEIKKNNLKAMEMKKTEEILQRDLEEEKRNNTNNKTAVKDLEMKLEESCIRLKETQEAAVEGKALLHDELKKEKEKMLEIVELNDKEKIILAERLRMEATENRKKVIQELTEQAKQIEDKAQKREELLNSLLQRTQKECERFKETKKEKIEPFEISDPKQNLLNDSEGPDDKESLKRKRDETYIDQVTDAVKFTRLSVEFEKVKLKKEELEQKAANTLEAAKCAISIEKDSKHKLEKQIRYFKSALYEATKASLKSSIIEHRDILEALKQMPEKYRKKTLRRLCWPNKKKSLSSYRTASNLPELKIPQPLFQPHLPSNPPTGAQSSTPNPAFQPPASAFQPTVSVFQPPAPAFQPHAPAFQPTASAFQLPAPAFQSPAPVFQTTASAFQPPVSAFQPPAPAFQTPAPANSRLEEEVRQCVVQNFHSMDTSLDWRAVVENNLVDKYVRFMFNKFADGYTGLLEEEQRNFIRVKCLALKNKTKYSRQSAKLRLNA